MEPSSGCRSHDHTWPATPASISKQSRHWDGPGLWRSVDVWCFGEKKWRTDTHWLTRTLLPTSGMDDPLEILWSISQTNRPVLFFFFFFCFTFVRMQRYISVKSIRTLNENVGNNICFFSQKKTKKRFSVKVIAHVPVKKKKKKTPTCPANRCRNKPPPAIPSFISISNRAWVTPPFPLKSRRPWCSLWAAITLPVISTSVVSGETAVRSEGVCEELLLEKTPTRIYSILYICGFIFTSFCLISECCY